LASDTVRDYPTPKAKKKIPVKHAFMLVLSQKEQNQQFIHLKQRPPVGIWGGLWCFPEFASLALCHESLLEKGIENYQQTLLPTFRHTFSHFHFDISPVLIEVDQIKYRQVMEESGALWYNLQQPNKIGLAAATQKILTAVSKIKEKEEIDV
jgi:A/G-specific adenine glycosylase